MARSLASAACGLIEINVVGLDNPPLNSGGFLCLHGGDFGAMVLKISDHVINSGFTAIYAASFAGKPHRMGVDTECVSVLIEANISSTLASQDRLNL